MPKPATTRLAIPQYEDGEVAAFSTQVNAISKAVDTNAAAYLQDTAAKRPAAGVPSRFFKATDTGTIYYDTGSAWEQQIRAADGMLVNASSAYGARVARSASTEYEPSATRPVFVNLEIRLSASGSAQIDVGGVFAAQLAVLPT